MTAPVRFCCAIGIAMVIKTLGAPIAHADDSPGAGSHLTRHEELMRAWATDDAIDLTNSHAVFSHVFSRLPPEVWVYPSENYYYWQLDVDGRHIQGNIRLSATNRDQGFINFAYSEPRISGGRAEPDVGRLSGRALLGADDGVSLKKAGHGVYDLGHGGHLVRFHLENLPQHAPVDHLLREGEEFVGRTCDESGLRFLLLFQRRSAYFFWVLDEATPRRATEHFVPLRDQAMIGRRTGFVFRVDPRAGNRKVLIAVSRHSVRANDYHDGPFDQLPDNHIETARLRERMILENPQLAGKIDAFGYYIEDEPPMRVALARYATYRDRDHLAELLAGGEAGDDWIEYFARRPK